MIYPDLCPLESECSLQVINSFFIGNVLNVYLYGVLTVQLYLYFVSFPEDRKLFKAVIYTVYVTETVYTVLLIWNLWYMLINSPKDHYLYDDFGGSLATILFCGGIVGFLTQAMYAYRIQIITKLKWLSWCIIAGILAQFLAISIMPLYGYSFALIITVWTSICLVVDVIVTAIMVWSLRRNEILNKEFRLKVMRLIYLIVGTGLLTVTTNIATLIAIAVPADIPLVPVIVLSKIYANSMMVLVNDRKLSPRSQDGRNRMVTVQLSSLQWASTGGTVNSPEERGPDSIVNNETEDGSYRTAVESTVNDVASTISHER